MRVIQGAGGGGKKGGGGGGEANNTVKAKSSARILMLVSEGKTGGLVNGYKSIYVNDVPIQNNDGSFNISDIQYDWRTGLPDQTYMAGFPAVEAEQNVGLEVKEAIPVTQAVTNLDATAVRVKLRIPALTTTDTKNGTVNPNSVMIAIDIRNESGTFSEVLRDTISEKFTSPYERAYRIQLTGTGPWYIRMRRPWADSNNTTNLNATYFSSFTVIEDYKLSYPDSALLGVIADAEQLGSSFPVITVDWNGIEVQVPTNFDPINRTYTGNWNGSFKLAVTDDPAWIFRDLIVNERYGLGEIIDEAFADKWGLYEISKYCNELVDDGYGGREARFRFNGTISSRDEAIRVLMAMAGVFRGIVYWGSGLITAVCDKPVDRAKLVAPANVVDGSFNYQGSALSARHTQAVVQFFDPEDAYKKALEVVEDYDAIDQYGLIQTQFQAIGCTSRGQAHRYGKWLLDTEQHESEIVTFRVGLDNADTTPGEVVDIADPSYAGIRMGGRVKNLILTAGKVSGVVLDAPVEIVEGESYTFSVVVGDGTIEDRPVKPAVGSTDTLNFLTPLVGVPIIGAMWILTGSNAAPRPFRVISVIENEKHQFDITAMFYDETKYARVEQGIVLEAPIFSTYPRGRLIVPSNLLVTEYLYLAGSTTIRTAATIGWTAPDDPRVTKYEVQILLPSMNGLWKTIAFTTDNTLDVQDLDPGIYGFRVRSLWDLSAGASDWITVTYNLNLVNQPPSDIDNFKITVLGEYSTLSWNPTDSLNWSHYIIRFTPEIGGASWVSSSILLPNVSTTSVQVPTRSGTYLIKAVNLVGIESVNASSIITFATGNILNAVESFVEQPYWSGIKYLTEVSVDSYLRLASKDKIIDWPTLSQVGSLYFGINGLELYGSYTSAQTVDLGEVFVSRVTPLISAFGDNTNNVISLWDSLSSVTQMSGTDPSDWAAILQMRFTLDNPSGPSPIWTDWAEAQTSDITARAYQMRVLLFSTKTNVTPNVRRAELVIDMPDRTFGGEDIVVPTAGLRVDFTPPYKALKGLGISAQGLAPGDFYEITGKDNTGFDIIFKDQTNSPVERTLDYVATGYGRVTT